jgi:hypothetical protein
MSIRAMVVAYAQACRLELGEVRPEWTGGPLRDANLIGADLRCVSLTDADLSSANLRGAYLGDANLCGVDLSDADLRGADLSYARLTGANLRGATLPDGRTLVEWQADPLAGLCDDPESVARALAAWGGRTWGDCPLHAALGADSFDDIAADRQVLAATFVALLDGGHLPRPTETVTEARRCPVQEER